MTPKWQCSEKQARAVLAYVKRVGGSPIDSMRAAITAAVGPEMSEFQYEAEKQTVKARAYGAIACTYGNALQSFADRGEALARCALDWRNSDSATQGVPRSSIEETTRLLQADDRAEKAEDERSAALAEVERLRGEHDLVLRELEAIGWPCRLVELPMRYAEMGKEVQWLRSRLAEVERERNEARALCVKLAFGQTMAHERALVREWRKDSAK